MQSPPQAKTWLKFEQLKSIELALLHIQCSPELVQDVLRHPDKYYLPLRVSRKKRSRPSRLVYKIISNDLRRVHRSIAIGLSPYINALPESVQGFRQGFNIVTNATAHCGQNEVVTADIHDFFGSISVEAVVRLFEDIGADSQVALMLARLCTLEDRLPQGGRASPAIANLIATSLDCDISQAYRGIRYTRYVDDLTFSGMTCPTETEIAKLLQAHGFKLKVNSFRSIKSGNGQYVTGLNVDTSKPKAPRRERRNIERALHVATKYSLEAYFKSIFKRVPTDAELAKYRLSLLGKIASYGNVDRNDYVNWQQQFADIL
jgi:RNA-directed DNA polymerase